MGLELQKKVQALVLTLASLIQLKGVLKSMFWPEAAPQKTAREKEFDYVIVWNVSRTSHPLWYRILHFLNDLVELVEAEVFGVFKFLKKKKKVQLEDDSNVYVDLHEYQGDATRIRNRLVDELQKKGLKIVSLDPRVWRSNSKSADPSTILVDGIKAPYRTLAENAPKLQLTKPTVIGGADVFSHSRRLEFENWRPSSRYFSSSERNNVITYLASHILSQTDGHQAVMPILKRLGIITDFFPLHDAREVRKVLKRWLRKTGHTSSLTQIAGYFGSEYGFYFGFFACYTDWLVLPALFGMYVSYLGASVVQIPNVDNMLIYYLLFNIVWAACFLKYWNRKSARLAHLWKVREDQTIAQPRQEFQGRPRESPITGLVELHYPEYRRWLKYMISYPICVFLMFLVTRFMFAYLELKATDDDTPAEDAAFLDVLYDKLLQRHIPNTFYSVCIMLFNKLFTAIAQALTKWENHRTEDDYRQHLVRKLVSFYVVNSYLIFFYLALVKQDFRRVQSMLSSYLITKQMISLLSQVVGPLVSRMMKVKKFMDSNKPSGDESLLNQVKLAQQGVKAYEREGQMEEHRGTFHEYIDVVTQFGFIVFFGWCWPLSGLAALLNNVIEVRSDAYVLCQQVKRPALATSGGIGAWQGIVSLMVYCSIFMNFMILTVFLAKDNQFNNLEDLDLFSPTVVQYLRGHPKSWEIVLVIICEHVFVAALFLFNALISDTPKDVINTVIRDNYHRGQCLQRMQTSIKQLQSELKILGRSRSSNKDRLVEKVAKMQELFASTQHRGSTMGGAMAASNVLKSKRRRASLLDGNQPPPEPADQQLLDDMTDPDTDSDTETDTEMKGSDSEEEQDNSLAGANLDSTWVLNPPATSSSKKKEL